MVVLSQILGFETAYLKLTFTFVPELIMGMLFGPFWTAVGASVADIAGMILFPKSAYFFGFTINAFVGGLIYGYFFYRKEVTWKRGSNSGLAEYPSDHIDFDTDLVGNDAEYSINKLAIWSARLMKLLSCSYSDSLIYLLGAQCLINA